MRRRLFLTALGATTFSPWSAQAQEPGRISIMEGLASMGFVEGRNLVVEQRSLDIRQFPAMAHEFAAAKADLIVAGGPGITAAKSATTSIPIVGLADDMVQEGHVESLSNRTGNTTGISILATELDIKRLEILMELLPR